MKKTWTPAAVLMISLTAALLLSGCGQSEAAAEADELLGKLEQLHYGSGAEIKAAAEAVEALSDKERGTLRNLGSMENIGERYEQALEEYYYNEYGGEWLAIAPAAGSLEIEARGAARTDGETAEWKAVFEYDSLEEYMTVDGLGRVENRELEGIRFLTVGTSAYIRAEDYDRVFESAELTGESIGEYAELVRLPGRDRTPEDSYYLPDVNEEYVWRSRAYEKGLTAVSEENIEIEVTVSFVTHGWKQETNTSVYRGLYGIPVWGGYDDAHTKTGFELGRVSGRVEYIRTEYVEKVDVDASGRRTVTLKNGIELEYGTRVRSTEYPF